MKAYAMIAVGTLMLASPAYAEDDAATLKAIEAKWSQSFVTNDMAYVATIIADDWVGMNAKGKFNGKAAMLAEAKSSKDVVKTTALRDVQVRMLGADYAVVQGYETDTGVFDGKAASRSYYWTDVFAKRGGHWMAINSQAAPLH